MTIINHASDGLYPELIALFRAVAAEGPIDSEELVRVCSVGNAARIRGALSRWTELGLFSETDGAIRLGARFSKKRGESLDALADRLPFICRHLILDPECSLPLWPQTLGAEPTEEGSGRTADFARGMAWTLAQDIYTFPSGSAESVEGVEREQTTGKFVFLNKTRWPGLRFWASYLGFSIGTDRAFVIDPTVAVREELPAIFSTSRTLTADLFVKELSTRLPVLDFGRYREEVESSLNESRWRRPPEGHLSMSLSLALRRLHLENTIDLPARADAGQDLHLCGRQYRTWHRFTHVEFKGELQ